MADIPKQRATLAAIRIVAFMFGQLLDMLDHSVGSSVRLLPSHNTGLETDSKSSQEEGE